MKHSVAHTIFAGVYPLVLVGAALTLNGCGNARTVNGVRQENSPTNDENTPRVQTVTVKQQDLEQKISLPGTVEGYETADLYAKVGGYLDEMLVDIGDEVSRGQVLARLAIPEMDKELRQREAAIRAAEAEVHQAEAAVNQALALVASAELGRFKRPRVTSSMSIAAPCFSVVASVWEIPL